MGRPLGITIKQIEDAIRASGGMLADAAKMLDCTHQNLCNRVGKSEKLKKVMKNYEKAFVKLAESQLMQGIKDGNQSSCMFYLKCKGGYSEKQNIELSQNQDKPIKFTIEFVKPDAKNTSA